MPPLAAVEATPEAGTRIRWLEASPKKIALSLPQELGSKSWCI